MEGPCPRIVAEQIRPAWVGQSEHLNTDGLKMGDYVRLDRVALCLRPHGVTLAAQSSVADLVCQVCGSISPCGAVLSHIGMSRASRLAPQRRRMVAQYLHEYIRLLMGECDGHLADRVHLFPPSATVNSSD